jgi:hypothetical protein
MANHRPSNNFHFLPLFIDGSGGKIAFFLIHFDNKIAFSGEGYNFSW